MIRAAVRPDLPTGTVTFLFTDVEGSTRLLHELGAGGYAEALAEHRRVIRQACTAEGGVEVDTQGDAFFFAFPTAPGALAAASAFTDALSEGPILVRVGLHTGTPLVADEGYVGTDVHRAARIAAAGHGGQVLVAATTASLVDEQLLDLGEHRFKDLGAPERVYQLGSRDFPPLRSLYRTNLPVPANPLVGREKELVDVLRLLAGDARLVTLTGPGGVGKTRFAVAAAGEASDSFPDGAWFVPLASLRDPALVLSTAAAMVGAEGDLVKHIGEQECLLLFDNLEHVIEAATEVADLVAACPRLRVLVTSREALRVSLEREFPLRPLAESPSVELFRQRSRAAVPDLDIAYADASAICERLDRLPLAIELAAARVKALTPAQILERLSTTLDLLKGGRDADPRQATLRATIEWSYQLLTAEEQVLFARLSVFRGGCTLEAAGDVCDADLDTLQSLVEKSLLRFSASEAGPRYWMLETIREYAAEQLDESGGADELRRRHAYLYLATAEDARMELFELSRGNVITQLETDLPNIRDALVWFRCSERQSEELRLIRALGKFWLARDHIVEGESVLQEALARIPDDGSDVRMRVELDLGEIAMRRGRPDEARPSVERWLHWAREQKDPSQIAWALSSLASIDMREGAFEQSVALLEEARDLGLPTGDVRLAANILGNLGYSLCGVGEYEQAAELCRESLELAPAVADAGVDHANLGLALLGLGDTAAASREYRTAIADAVESGHFFTLADALVGAAAVALNNGSAHKALVVLGAVDALRAELDLPAEPLEHELSVRTEGGARAELGEHADAAWLNGRSLTVDEAVEYALASLD